jgi:type I restriction enzyme, S subunit
MKKGWEIKKLNEVCDFQNGFAFKSNRFKDSGYPILRISNIQDEVIDTRRLVYFQPKDYKDDLKKYQVVKGDLLIAMSGATTGKIGFNTTDQLYYLNQRVGKFKPKDGLQKRFLFYFLSTRVEENLRISAGSAQPNLSTEQIKDFAIPVPPLLEQKRIVGILDEAFEGIATAKDNAEKNLQNARALFESYLQSVFTQRGDGWVEERLGNLCSIGDGNYSSKYPKASEFLSEGIPFLTATNLKNGTIAEEGMRFISSEQHKQLVKGHVKTGDLVIVVRGSSTGNSSIVPRQFSGANLNSQLAYLRPIDKISNQYLFYSFNSSPIQEIVRREISGAAQPQLPNNKLLDITIWYPPLQEQQTLVDRFNHLREETQRLESIYKQKLAALEELKKSVLHQAFNGEL